MVCTIASAATLFFVVPEKVPDNFILPATSNLLEVAVTPIPTFPEFVTTNADVSGFVLSSTTKAFPVPV